jgi:hypothetical protein
MEGTMSRRTRGGASDPYITLGRPDSCRCSREGFQDHGRSVGFQSRVEAALCGCDILPAEHHPSLGFPSYDGSSFYDRSCFLHAEPRAAIRQIVVIGFGCLAPIILFVLGALAGHLLIGSAGVPWGAGIGFVSGLAVLGFVGWLLGKTKGR